MPCYRCGVRQTDPSRGQSPWKRGVRRNSQILICPGCQATDEWMAELDRCAQCSSVHLVRRLGEVECRDCGAIVPPAGDPAAGDDVASGGAETLADAGPSPGLAEEVAQALERVLSQGLASQSSAPRGADRQSARHEGAGRQGPVRSGAATR
jgi:hypothetical protein